MQKSMSLKCSTVWAAGAASVHAGPGLAAGRLLPAGPLLPGRARPRPFIPGHCPYKTHTRSPTEPKLLNSLTPPYPSAMPDMPPPIYMYFIYMNIYIYMYGRVRPRPFIPGRCPYRGTSLIRNSPPLGPYSRTKPRALWWS